MERTKIVVSGRPDRETVTVRYRHIGDGVWEAEIGGEFEEYASFGDEPSEDSEAQSRTVQQLLRKEFSVDYGGDPERLLD